MCGRGTDFRWLRRRQRRQRRERLRRRRGRGGAAAVAPDRIGIGRGCGDHRIRRRAGSQQATQDCAVPVVSSAVGGAAANAVSDTTETSFKDF